MSVRIRLARGGTKKRPFYRIVAADGRDPRDGRFLERLGTYNPLLPSEHPERVVLKEERLRYWLDTGAAPSDRVARFLDGAGITQNRTRWRGTGKRANELEAKQAEAAAAAKAGGPAEATTAQPAAAAAAAEKPAAAEPAAVAEEKPAAAEPEAAAEKSAAESEAVPQEGRAATEPEVAPDEPAAAADEAEPKAVPASGS